MEDFEKYKIDYNNDAEMFCLQDLLNLELIVLTKEQLEILILEYCKLFNHKII